METNITKRTDIYNIDPRNVVVVDNFNVRRDFAIDELKEQMIALLGIGCRVLQSLPISMKLWRLCNQYPIPSIRQ